MCTLRSEGSGSTAWISWEVRLENAGAISHSLSGEVEVSPDKVVLEMQHGIAALLPTCQDESLGQPSGHLSLVLSLHTVCISNSLTTFPKPSANKNHGDINEILPCKNRGFQRWTSVFGQPSPTFVRTSGYKNNIFFQGWAKKQGSSSCTSKH